MDDELRRMLRGKKVDEAVVTFMESPACNCINFEVFANFVDEAKELNARILAKTTKKDDDAQLAVLKQAWRETDAIVKVRIKRTADGLSDEMVDEPLDAEVQRNILATFRKMYKWNSIPAKQMGDDFLIGRVRREFERRQPSMWAVNKVRTLAHSRRSVPAKKQRIGSRLSIQVDGHESDDDGVDPANDTMPELFQYLTQLQILCLVWAIAGCFSVDHNGEKREYVTWPEACAYFHVFQSRAFKLLGSHTTGVTLRYISTIEEHMRTQAIDLARSEDVVPWGLALSTALKDESDIWNERKDLLRGAGAGGSQQSQRPPVQTALGNGGSNNDAAADSGKGRGKNSQSSGSQQQSLPSRKKWKTQTLNSRNQKFCKAFNDKRGCERNCPRGECHACDIQLATGRACESKTHNRNTHDAASHGTPAYVS